MPKRVGPFDIIDFIGRGGMGCVYRARDRRLGREVALKCPRPDLLDRPKFRRRFLREARTASHLLHPNITTVFETFEIDGMPWLALEYVDGGSLRSRLSQSPKMAVEEIVAHAEGLTSALVAAHAAHILHRDINPNNILIGSDGRARLTDFGLAQAVRDSSLDPNATTMTRSTDITGQNKIVGTRGYMSPEQALGRELDARSDIFSLGLVLYEMCTGHPAFARSDDSWIDDLLHHEPEPVCQYNYEVPAELERVIRKATAKRPDERYQAASDMLADVRALRRSLESGARVADVPDRPAPRWITKPATVVAAAVVVLSVALIATVLTLGRDADDLLFHNWTSHQLTSTPGWEGEPALSPDGALIAYSSEESGSSDIWLVDKSGGSRLRLTTHPASDSQPAWFPDGSKIAFVSDRSGEPSIWKVPSLGGSPVMVVQNASHPAVSPDGRRIAFSRSEISGSDRIFVAPLDAPDQAMRLTGDDDGLWEHTSPAWSPDGSKLCYSDFRDLWIVPADGGPARMLTTDHGTDRDPVWSPDGRWLLFSSMREGITALWRVSAKGRGVTRVTTGTGPERQPSLSGDGTTLVYSTYSDDMDVEIHDLSTGATARIPGKRFDGTPEVTPSGDAVVFSSDRRGKFDLWVQPLVDGRPDGNPRLLTDHPGSAATSSVSPDGRWVAYFRVLGQERDIWAIPIDGGVPVQLTTHPGIDIQPAFSPDGKFLAFASDRGGAQNIWVAPVADGRSLGEPVQVTRGSMMDRFPSWSPDGTRLAFIRDDEVWIARLESGDEPVRLTDGVRAEFVRWDRGGNGLVVAGQWDPDHVEIRRVPLDGSASVPFDPKLEFPQADDGLITFGISADGRVLAVGVRRRSGDLWVLSAENGS